MIGLLQFAGVSSAIATGWNVLPLGAGGFVPQIAMAADGTRVVTTDVGNAYKKTSGTGSWTPLLTTTSLPAGTISNNGGIFSIAIAPNNTQRFYLCWQSNGTVYTSTNRGVTWTATALSDGDTGSNDGATHDHAKGMAVDPANESVIWFGSKSALHTSADAGVTWTTKTSSVGTPTSGGPGYQIAFDPTSAVTGGKTQGIYVFVYGVGLYYSSNGGTSFTSVSATGSPTTFGGAMVVGSDGVVFVINDTGNQLLYKYTGQAGGTWSSVSVGSTGVGSKAWAVAIDPANSTGSTRRIVAVAQGGPYSVSINNAVSFSGFSSQVSQTIAATDVPWLALSGSGNISAGCVSFDPLLSNIIIVGAGVGVWTTSPVNSSNGASVTYTSQSLGIEELVVNDIIAPNGVPIVIVEDRGSIFANSVTNFPSTYNNVAQSNNSLLSEGWHVDYSGGNANFMAIAMESITGSPAEQSSTSSDGGQTWTALSNPPSSNGFEGNVAAGFTSSDMLWAANLSAAPLFTTNGGTTWTSVSIATVSFGGWNGVLLDQLIASDKSSQKHYLWDPASGFYSSTTGASWTRVNSTTSVVSTGTWAIVKAAPPGFGGFLGISRGFIGDGHIGILLSQDGGATFTPVTSLEEVGAWGFGQSKPSSGVPTIFANGSIGGVFGVYRSTDWGVTWTSLGNPNNIPFFINTISGDNTDWRKVYVGFSQQGAVYGVFN